MHGYGVIRWTDEREYYGQMKENKHDGYGYKKDYDGSEYYGQWKKSKRNGDAVLIENG
jgi:hypothetical protein